MSIRKTPSVCGLYKARAKVVGDELRGKKRSRSHRVSMALNRDLEFILNT